MWKNSNPYEVSNYSLAKDSDNMNKSIEKDQLHIRSFIEPREFNYPSQFCIKKVKFTNPCPPCKYTKEHPKDYNIYQKYQ